MTGLNNLQIDTDGQKRLQNYFDDLHIRYGENVRTHRMECWYVPSNSRPYRIRVCCNVPHAKRILESRAYADKKHALTLLQEIDEHNDKLINGMREDAIGEVRSQMRSIASGKQHFMAR